MKINMHTSHPSAFISSTFVDLFEDRSVVAEALRRRGLNINALDIRPASTQSSKIEIQNGIRESDFVILIIGDRFGSILKNMTGNDSQSITWWEYTNAIKQGKPIIAYFKNVDSSDPLNHDERNNSDYKKKRKLFQHFKKIVTNKHNPSYYTDPYDLSLQIDGSLISIYRSGVKDLSSKNSDLNYKVSRLKSEISIMQSKLTTSSPSNSGNSLSELLGLGLTGNQTTENKSAEVKLNSLFEHMNKYKK